MPIPDDADPDVLISRLAGGLAPADRDAFRRAAESALGALPCAGPGSAYRTISVVWRGFFDPPAFTGWDIAHELESMRRSKLTNGPPIGADDPRTGARDRRRFKLVG
jgi:hypothetical protein